MEEENVKEENKKQNAIKIGLVDALLIFMATLSIALAFLHLILN